MQMKKLISVLLALLLSASVFAAVQSNSMQQVFFLAEPVVITLLQPLPATVYKGNSYVTSASFTNNGPNINPAYGNIEVVVNGSPTDGTGISLKLYDATTFYTGASAYATIEESIANGEAAEQPLSFDPAAGIYRVAGWLNSGDTGYSAISVAFGANAPTGTYSFAMFVSDS